MKKRGVSPLIASVLLISFVILLFVLITTWVRKSAIEPSMSIAEEKLASVLNCVSVKIDIVSACADGNLELKVDNMGDTVIAGVRVRMFKDGDIENGQLEGGTGDETSPFDRISAENTSITLVAADASDVTKVEVYPIIKGGKVCQGEMESINSVDSSC